MLSKVIEYGNFECITTRIAEILANELSNQKTLIQAEIDDEETTPERLLVLNYYKSVIPKKVWDERFIQPDIKEFPFINVLTERTTLDQLVSPSNQTGILTLIVECWMAANSNVNITGDSLASQKLKRLLSISRTILMDKEYRFLDNNIGSLIVKDIRLMTPETGAQSTDNSIYGCFKIDIKLNETVRDLDGLLWEEDDVNIEINESGKGLSFIIN